MPYYHVYLSVSQYGDKYRAELFTEDLGGTEGQLLPIEWRGVDDWYPFLLQAAAAMPATGAEDLGERLFQHLLGNPANQAKWAEVVQQATQKNQVLRLLVDSSIPDEDTERNRDKIHNLPYGLLRDRDKGYYLFRPRTANQQRPEIQFLRVLRRVTPRPLKLQRRPLRLLLAAAEPSEAQFHFDCVGRLAELAQLLAGARAPAGEIAFEVFVVTSAGVRPVADLLVALSAGPAGADPHATYCRTTRDGLRATLAEGDYDILHVLAHGFGTGVVLCDAAGNRADVVSEELAAWCGASRNLELAFLQACWAAQVQGRGSLGGVAQRLLNPQGGNLAAVIASSYPLDAADSTEAACGFYRALAQQGASDLALDRSLDLTKWSWALLELWVRLSPLGIPSSRGAIQYLSPYRGLGSFQERDAPMFFGRDAEVAELLEILAQEPVVLIVGDAGSGKSSLLRAGLAHRVRTQGLAGREWNVVLMRPGYSPLQSLLEALSPQRPAAPVGTVAPPLPQRLAELSELLGRVCTPERPLLLICDQFEELFTLSSDEKESLAVAQVLAELSERQRPDARPYFRLVLALRSEFLGAVADLSTALPGKLSLPKRPWLLGPPGLEDLRRIVTRPAEVCGYQFEGPLTDGNPEHQRGLLERIFQEPLLSPRPAAAATGGASASALPLLEFALQQLWLEAVRRDRDTQLFTHADYDRLGGLGGAIGTHAENVYQEILRTPGLGPNPRELVETLLGRLVGASGTRRPRPRNDLVTGTNDPRSAHWVIDRLVDERLLTVRPNPDCPEDRNRALVELTHDVLLERWPRLKSLVTDNPRDRELRERFESDFDRWDKGQPPDSPPRSGRLLPSYHASLKYLVWLDVTRRQTLTEAQKTFVQSLRRKVAWRRGLVVGGVIGSLLLAVFMTALYLWGLYEQAQVEKQKAVVEEHLYVTEMRGASDAWEEGDVEQVREVLEKWARRGPEWDYLSYLINREWSPPNGKPRTLPHDNRPVTALAYSQDGKHLLSATQDGTVRLWDVARGRVEKSWQAPAGEVEGVALSPDRQTVAVWSREGSDSQTTAGHLRLYDARSGEPLPDLRGPRDGITWARFVITWASFSPDGQQLAVAGWQMDAGGKQVSTHVATWAAADWRNGVGGTELLPAGKPHELMTVIFSPDGKAAAVGGAWREDQPEVEGPVKFKVWDLATKTAREPPFVTANDNLNDATLVASACAQQLAGVTGDNSVLLWEWDGRTWQRTNVKLSPPDPINTLAFTQDGRTLATGDQGRVVRLWDLASGQVRRAFKGHAAKVKALAFSPDDRILASGAADGKVKLWDAVQTNQNFYRFQGEKILTLAFSRHGGDLAVGTASLAQDEGERLRSGHLSFWEVGPTQAPPPKLGYSGTVIEALASTHDGATLAAAEQAGIITLWEMPARLKRATLSGHKGAVYAVAFSPDGTLLASGGEDGTTRLWGVAQGEPIATLTPGGDELTEPIQALSFSWDSKFLASGGKRGTLRLWDVVGRQEKQPRLPVSRGSISALAFSPRSYLLVSAGEDPLAPPGKDGQTIHWWDVQTMKPHGLPNWHGGQVWAVVFSPDGQRLVSASETGTVKLWDVSTQLELLTLAHPQVPVKALAFSSDGRLLATGDDKGVVRLWWSR